MQLWQRADRVLMLLTLGKQGTVTLFPYHYVIGGDLEGLALGLPIPCCKKTVKGQKSNKPRTSLERNEKKLSQPR